MATYVREQVFDSRLTMLNLPGGSTHSWARKLAAAAVVNSKRMCPRREGDLRASINMGRGISGNAAGVYSHIYADSSYAWFVHEGTGPYILPKTKPYLKWKGWGPWAAGGGKITISGRGSSGQKLADGYWRAEYVRGQAANPFLWKGCRAAYRAYGITGAAARAAGF